MIAMRSYVWPTVLLAARIAPAEISVSVDKLDPSDGISLPPPTLVVVDVEVILSATDAYYGLGLLARTENGARLEYARNDPNGVVVPTAPGPDRRFVTFFSRPRNRDGDGRFGAGASMQVIASHVGGPVAIFTDSEINAALADFQSVPGRSGWVGRIALDLSDVVDPLFRMDSANIVIATSPPPNSIRLLHVSTYEPDNRGLVVYSSSNDHAEISFGLYGLIPEPTTALGLLVIAGAFVRRR